MDRIWSLKVILRPRTTATYSALESMLVWMLFEAACVCSSCREDIRTISLRPKDGSVAPVGRLEWRISPLTGEPGGGIDRLGSRHFYVPAHGLRC
jgi:hypothetical protein